MLELVKKKESSHLIVLLYKLDENHYRKLIIRKVDNLIFTDYVRIGVNFGRLEGEKIVFFDKNGRRKN